MAVYLGAHGVIELTRTSEQNYLNSTLDPADVNVTAQRFSFDFGNNRFMTGDLLEITRMTTTGVISTSNLDFVDAASFPGGAQSPQGQWYVNVDAANGVWLYSTWNEALIGGTANAAVLATPASTYPIRVQLKNNARRILGEVTDYELNTNRETADVTSLGEAFRQRISTLITGSGSCTAFWNYEAFATENRNINGYSNEVSHYLHQLVLRQDLGASFRARFYLKTRLTQPYTAGVPGPNTDQIFYDLTGVITDVGVAFNADEPVRSRINFVTTGELALLSEPAASLVLNQTGGTVVQQNNAGNVALQTP
jgi:hypothetical protein